MSKHCSELQQMIKMSSAILRVPSQSLSTTLDSSALRKIFPRLLQCDTDSETVLCSCCLQ